ncbi:MAG TPA: ATP-binding protein, partial [Saprospiraceae bacterium]|nr:ATP-binding protein [Saprospiraceae bacterium]
MDLGKPYIITIVGAESSGKTTLALLLTSHFKGTIVTEYAREYLSSLGRAYNEKDLQMIAEMEFERINKAIKGDLLFEADGEENLPNDLIYVKAHSINEMLIDFKLADRAVIIVDGGMLTLRMWARIKYNMEIPVVEDALQQDVTDLYILCKPRKEWEPDPLREAPDIIQRVWIYNQYLREIMKM